MKNKMKRTLRHEIDVAGKTVPTVFIVGLFLLGGGSAALLTNFGTVDGSTSIQQSFTIDGRTPASTGGTQITETVEVVGGETVVTNHEASNKLSRSIDINVTSKAPKELSMKYRLVDQLVADTDYFNFTDSDADIEGDMKSEVAYNPDDNKVGVRAYGQSVYKQGSNPNESQSYAGIGFDVQDTALDGRNTIEVNYSVGQDQHANVTGTGNSPGWIRYKVETTGSNRNGNVVEEQLWMIADKTVDETSGTSMTLDDTSSFGDNLDIYEIANRSNKADLSDLKDNADIKEVQVLVGSESNQARYKDLWYYNVSFDGEQRIDAYSGNFTRSFDGGTTQVGVAAQAKVNAFSDTGIPYNASFDPMTSGSSGGR